MQELFDAIDKHDIEKTRRLLRYGANPNVFSSGLLKLSSIKDEKGLTPLVLAVTNGDLEIVLLLLDNKAGPDIKYENLSPLVIATMAAVGNRQNLAMENIIRVLLRYGANPNSKYTATGMTVLMISLFLPTKDITELLLKKGANPNIKDNKGMTALMHAVGFGDVETVKLLLKSGAKRNIKDDRGMTALDHAVIKNNKDIVKLFTPNFGSQILKEIKEKRYLYKWEPLCTLGNKDIASLRQQAVLFKIKDADKKTKRELCAELSKKIGIQDKGDISVCENNTTIGGDDVKDIPKPLVYRLKEGNKIFCFNILELIRLYDNPYTRKPLPLAEIQKKWKKVQQTLVNSKLRSQSLIDEITMLKYNFKNKTAMLKLKIINLSALLDYTNPDEIEKMNTSQIKRLYNNLLKYDLMRPLKSERNSFRAKPDLETFVNIFTRILKIGDSNKSTRKVIFTEELEKSKVPPSRSGSPRSGSPRSGSPRSGYSGSSGYSSGWDSTHEEY